MGRKERFLDSTDFGNLKGTNTEKLILKLIDQFENEGYKFYPEWRDKHKSGKIKNFTFKVEQPAESVSENLITIYPQSDQLKVEVYRSQTNKKHYIVSLENIDDSAQMKTLLDDARGVYNSISILQL